MDSTFALGSKTFLPTLKPDLTTSAPRLDTGARYSLPGQEFHLTNYCAPNRRTSTHILYRMVYTTSILKVHYLTKKPFILTAKVEGFLAKLLKR